MFKRTTLVFLGILLVNEAFAESKLAMHSDVEAEAFFDESADLSSLDNTKNINCPIMHTTRGGVVFGAETNLSPLGKGTDVTPIVQSNRTNGTPGEGICTQFDRSNPAAVKFMMIKYGYTSESFWPSAGNCPLVNGSDFKILEKIVVTPQKGQDQRLKITMSAAARRYSTLINYFLTENDLIFVHTHNRADTLNYLGQICDRLAAN